MDHGPLVELQTEGGRRLLDRLAQEHVPIAAACWLRETEERPWSLCLVTPLVEKDGPKKPALLRILGILTQMPPPILVSPLAIRVVPIDSPIAQAIDELHRRYPGVGAFHLPGKDFAGKSVEGVYIYPPIPAAVS
jgi:hypothetical protein